MITQLLSAEWLKIKRKGLWFLALLGPVGVVALQMVNYGVRKDYLLSQSDDDWSYYLSNVAGFTPLALVLGLVILTSFMASIENETNAWKQWIALPISKMSVYVSKFVIVAILLFVSSCILAILTLLYGKTLGLGENIPWLQLLSNSFYPYLACLALVGLHLWFAVIIPNQGVTISIGIMGVIICMMSYYLPDWVIWKWPTLINDWNNPLINVVIGVGTAIILLVIGMWDFNRRDVA